VASPAENGRLREPALVRFTAPGDWTVDTGTGTQIFRRRQVYRLKIGPNRRELKLYSRG